MKRALIILYFGFLLFSVSFASLDLDVKIEVDMTGRSRINAVSSRPFSIAGIESENNIIHGSSEMFSSKNGRIWEFSFPLNASVRQFVLVLSLPQNSTIINITANTHYSVSYSNGMKIVFLGNNIRPNISVHYTVGSVSYTFYFVSAVLGIFILAPFVLEYSKSRTQSDIAINIVETLNEKERIVFNNILENNCETNQNLIRHATGIPKATLSRIVYNLERKKIVERRRNGSTLKVRIRKPFQNRST